MCITIKKFDVVILYDDSIENYFFNSNDLLMISVLLGFVT